jgi:hypothetical protein
VTDEIRWPANRFYWSIIEAPQWRRAGPLPAGLMPAFEEDLPVEASILHAVCVPMDGGGLLVCAVEAEALARVDASTQRLCPGSLPAFVAPGLCPRDLNLLVGRYEPRQVRRARTRKHALGAAAALAASGLIAAGLVRRGAELEAAAAEAELATANSLAACSPGKTLEAFARELASLRRSGESAASVRPAPDAALALAGLLRRWPAVPSKPQSIAVSEAGATVSVSVEGDSTPFLKAFQPPQGWVMDEPRLNSGDALTRLTLHVHPAQGAAP